ECAVEVGQLLGVQLMLAGSVGKIGGLYSFDLRIIDVGTGHIIKTASHDLSGDITTIMRHGMAELAGIIAGSGSIQAAQATAVATIYGLVDIISTPVGAKVLIDGEEKGTTPALSNRLTASQSHTIQVSLDGYATVDTIITTRQNSRLRVDLTLQQLMGWLTIEANVPSTVFLDNQRAGKTPLTRLEYGIGDYALKVSRPEYFPFKGTIFIPQNNEARQSVVLQKKPKAPAMIMSLALPGSGQLYQGHSLKALVFGGAAIGLAFLAYDEQQSFDDSNDEFIHWRDEYNNEIDPEQMAIKKAIAQEVLDDMSQAETNRNLYLGILGGVWTVNILDILF
ncbi:MAG: PEGA domain-containing protein, partial [Candidatus Neomarinimicrobiota bacterium]